MGEGRVSRRRKGRVRAEISNYLSHEFWVSRAEIARPLGVSTLAIAKAIENMKGEGNEC
jgi:biotin operon repressor